MTETSRHVLHEGSFRPDPSDSAACSTQTPECCIENRDYTWKVFGIDEIARVRLQTQRYR